ncbi:metallophosphoesterase [Lampropedia cohaerens]|uniref:Metallophosphoesterase n=1 Tax=Lampropedia cohaerens TaxID=1610491 RepID=A0A0U1Q2W6_9BURK|nr:metallophosphoesterase [Lampropedia cohaerens]KKW69089.1 metallophosphoesterase [Lampropedia cohaerens]
MNATTRLQRFAPNHRGRDLAVGDIHGCFSKLSEALHRIGFAPERDRLFAVGDLVGRGPESPQVLHWLAQPWFHSVCGNHDLMTWRRALGIPLQEVDHVAHGGQWLDALAAPVQRKIAQGLRALPLALEVQTALGPVGIVHADFPYDDWQAIASGSFSANDAGMCLWSIERYRCGYRQPVRNVRAVIHGHMTVSRPAQLGNVFFIDTGGWRDGGRFTLLDLRTLRPA